MFGGYCIDNGRIFNWKILLEKKHYLNNKGIASE